jgi:hypothetical protein
MKKTLRWFVVCRVIGRRRWNLYVASQSGLMGQELASFNRAWTARDTCATLNNSLLYGIADDQREAK